MMNLNEERAREVEIRRLAACFPSKAMSTETAALYLRAMEQFPLRVVMKAVDWFRDNWDKEGIPPIATLKKRAREIAEDKGDLKAQIRAEFQDKYHARVGPDPVPYRVCRHGDWYPGRACGCTLSENQHRHRRTTADDVWDEIRHDRDDPKLGPMRTTERTHIPAGPDEGWHS